MPEKTAGQVAYEARWGEEGIFHAESDRLKAAWEKVGQAVIAAQPESLLAHDRRVKAGALREMARLFMATNKSDLSYYNRDLAARFCKAEADRLEAAAGAGGGERCNRVT